MVLSSSLTGLGLPSRKIPPLLLVNPGSMENHHLTECSRELGEQRNAPVVPFEEYSRESWSTSHLLEFRNLDPRKILIKHQHVTCERCHIMSSLCMLKVYPQATLSHLARFRGNSPYERSLQRRKGEWRGPASMRMLGTGRSSWHLRSMP